MSRLSIYAAALKNLGWAGTFQRRRVRRLPAGSSGQIYTKCSEHPVWVRGGTSDKFVFDQIFVDREYRCLDNLHSVRTIIDAGANVGYSAAYLLSKYPEARAICIEPDAENFKQLQLNMAPFGTRATLFQGALWSEPTTLSFDASTTEVGHEWGRQVVKGKSGNVDALDVPTLMSSFDLDSIDLLKIDIEGAEQQVFSAPDTSWLDRVKAIVVELHGPECSRAFEGAIGTRYALSRCDELTVCLPSGR